MKAFMKKTAALLLALVLGILSPFYGNVNVSADETAAQAAPQIGKDFLQKVIGEYQPLFEGASFDEKYDHYWHDYSAAVVGESMNCCVRLPVWKNIFLIPWHVRSLMRHLKKALRMMNCMRYREKDL